jgi:LuxR family maltose regulon positive regulatory protein
MLTLLERSNVFLERLECEPGLQPAAARPWYRYHALFAEAMRNAARHRLGEASLQHLSGRASHWYEHHGFLDEAIEAALAAQDDTRTAMLLIRFLEERTVPGEVQEPQTLLRWFKQLPEAHFEQHPALCLGYATTLLLQSAAWAPDASSIPLMERLLSMAERSCRAEHRFPKLGEILAFRALLALRQGKVQVATICAKQALDWLSETQDIWRGLSTTIAATAGEDLGQFVQARSLLHEAQTRLARTNNQLFRQAATIKLAQVHFELGELQQAASWYRQALEASPSDGDANLAKRLTHWRCIALLGLARLCYTRNELERASQLLQEAMTLSQRHAFLHHEVHASLELARVQQAQGQVLVAQHQLIDLLERIPVSESRLVQEIQTAQARLALSIGDPLTVQEWAFLRTPPADVVQRTEEEVLLVRWLRTQGKEEEASHRLEQLLLATREAGHTRCLLEAMVEMVLSALASKRKAEAQDLLREVLILALPHHPVRVFLDAGEPLAMLLRALLPQCHDQPLRAYVRTLLRAFPAAGTPTPSASLVEPLSSQEQRVFRLLAEHRTNAEIAEMMVVSINTVRTQVQSIYRKLGVHKRSEALDVARDLTLF